MAQQEVRFDLYCGECKYCNLDEVRDPCNECLDYYSNEDTDRPVFYEEKEK